MRPDRLPGPRPHRLRRRWGPRGRQRLHHGQRVDKALAPGEFSDAIIIAVDTAGVDSLRLVGVANEAECNVDGDNEVVLSQPFCEAPT